MKILREMVRSTTMGMNAIDNVMPYVEDEALASLMSEQKEGMNTLLAEAKRGLSADEIAAAEGEAKRGLSADEIAAAEGGKLGKTVLKASSAISAMLNGDTSHLARMLTEGYETGIVSLQKCINELQKSHEEVPVPAKELLKTYDKNIRALRKFL